MYNFATGPPTPRLCLLVRRGRNDFVNGDQSPVIDSIIFVDGRMRMTHTTVRVLGKFLEVGRPLSGADLINSLGLFSGTLYPILQRMENEGWLVGTWEDDPPTVLGRPNRKYYKLTGVGQTQAEKAMINERTRKFFVFGNNEPQGA
jgi:PadR family transcriptional regulator, regulatory protein PadR